MELLLDRRDCESEIEMLSRSSMTIADEEAVDDGGCGGCGGSGEVRPALECGLRAAGGAGAEGF